MRILADALKEEGEMVERGGVQDRRHDVKILVKSHNTLTPSVCVSLTSF